MRNLLLTYFVALLCFSSCGDQAYYEENKSIVDRSWEYSNIPEFKVHVDNKSAKYAVYVNIRHGADYDFSNIYFLLHQKGPQFIDTAHRKEITLAQLDGRWIGRSAGSLYEIQQLVYPDFVFPDTGLYTFSIEQNMRQNPLHDVSDVGIKIIKK